MAKAVIFDKDGVIVQSTRLHLEVWKRTFAIHNKKISLAFMRKYMMGRSAKENIKAHLDPNIADKKMKQELNDQLTFIRKNYRKYIEIVPGILNFLKKLKKAKIRAALATSSRRETTDLFLDTLKLREYFNSITTSDDVTKAKPDPEIYLKAAKNLRVKPADSVVFEDSYSGIEAAKRAGMKVVLVTTSLTKKEISNVDLSIKDFTKISISDLRKI